MAVPGVGGQLILVWRLALRILLPDEVFAFRFLTFGLLALLALAAQGLGPQLSLALAGGGYDTDDVELLLIVGITRGVLLVASQ